MEDACYIKDTKTGRFMGRRPGCSNNTGEASEKLLQKVEQDKSAIVRRVEAAAAAGTLQRQDSAAKDKAEELARAVNSGKMSYPEALYELTKDSRSSGRYAKAIDLLDRDASYWNGIRSKTGSDEVDTLIGSYAGAPVPGAADFALNLAGGKSGVQNMSDEKSYRPAPKLDHDTVSKEGKKQADDIKKKATNYDEINKDRHMEDPKNHTQCSGNECTTHASLYSDEFHKQTSGLEKGNPKHTASGELFNKYKYTAAMQPELVGRIPYNKDEGHHVYAKVTNLGTKPPQSVIVKVNDRGPYAPVKINGKSAPMPDPTRGIDLSQAAYAKIAGDNMNKGILNVKVEFLDSKEGLRQYNEQNARPENRQPAIDNKVREAQCLHDSDKFKNNPENHCPKSKRR
ncbi:MAG: hypothetical protein HQK99_09345 [Nitrospirae bacterium]|nr:hypothetical protein [Nitrospirota bacterium]